MPEETQQLTWGALRRCEYCRGEFRPTRPQDRKRRFCCEKHRKAIFRHGTLPYERLKADVLKLVRAELDTALESLERRISALERSKKKPLDSRESGGVNF